MTALESDGRSLRNVHGMSTYIDNVSYRISRSLELCHNNRVTSNMRIPEPLGRTKDSWAVQPMVQEPKEVKLLSDQLRNFRWPGIFLQVLFGSYRKLFSAPGALLKYFKHAACMNNTRKKFWQDPYTFEKCACLQSELHCGGCCQPEVGLSWTCLVLVLTSVETGSAVSHSGQLCLLSSFPGYTQLYVVASFMAVNTQWHLHNHL